MDFEAINEKHYKPIYCRDSSELLIFFRLLPIGEEKNVIPKDVCGRFTLVDVHHELF